MLKLNIGQKSLVFFLLITFVPLSGLSTYWLRQQQKNLKDTSIERQLVLTASAANKVENFLTTKVNTLILHSQTNSVQSLDKVTSKHELEALLFQDSDLERVSLVDSNGNEVVVEEKDGSNPGLMNVAETPPFKAATFLSGKEYIGPVEYNESNEPVITIAVPLVSFETRQKIGELSTAEAGVIRNKDEIKGVLIAKTNLKNLWSAVLSSKIGNNGYAYLVDSRGSLIAYPDLGFLKTNTSLNEVEQVQKFLVNPKLVGVAEETISEKNERVLSTFHRIDRTGWAVIAQEPVESIFAPVGQVTRATAVLFIAIAVILTILSFLFSRTLTKPLDKLVIGTSQFSEGNFNYRVQVHSDDEIGLLAQRFNNMAENIKLLVANVKGESDKLSAVLDSVGESIVAINSSGRIILANSAAAQLHGASTDYLRGKSFDEEFIFIKNGSQFQLDLDTNDVIKEIQFTSQNRQLHYLDVLINRIEGDQNGITHIITLRDITEERELEDMKLDFVSMAAHELRTPITAIRGYLSLLLSSAKNLSEDMRQSLKKAESSSKQVAILINNLLNVSKIERGSMTINYSKVNWKKLIKECISDQQFNAKIKNLTVELKSPNEDIEVVADSVAIKEVVNNLLANAINYTPENGHIRIGVVEEHNSILTYVKDNGSGMSPNAVKRLFTKFYRARSGLASGSGGTGLGLYISKSIIELHKGSIHVESELGKGSIFSFRLPKIDDVQYRQLTNLQEKIGEKHRGWVTKNTPR